MNALKKIKRDLLKAKIKKNEDGTYTIDWNTNYSKGQRYGGIKR